MGKRMRILSILAALALALVVWKAWDGSVQTTSADPWPPVEVTQTATSNANGTVTFAVTVKNVTTVDLLNVELRGSVESGASYVDSYQAGPGDDKGKFDGTSVNWIVTTLSPGKSKGPYNYILKGDGTLTSHVWMRWTGKQGGSLTTADVSAAVGTVTTSPTTPSAPSATTPSASGTTTTTQKEVPLTPATAAPEAELQIVPVPANAANPLAIQALLESTGKNVAMGTTGLDNVPVGVPVYLQGNVADPKNGPARTYKWTFAGPNASKSKLDKTDAQLVKFTPDVSGIYKVDVVITNEKGSSEMASVQIHAGNFIGSDACKSCHADKYSEWSNTAHAKLFHEEINGGADPSISDYNEGCVRCHVVGFTIGAANGGYTDVKAKTGWQFPPLSDIQAGKDNFGAMPKALQSLANIGCENCHGPGLDHVTKGAKMATSLDNGACNVCHAGGGHHVKGVEITNSKHTTGETWESEAGPAEQGCVRCHSGAGYMTFTQAPTEQAAWDNSFQDLTCVSCHDPHSDANPNQLRINGKPVAVPAGLDTKDVGLSATCYECHNSRRSAADAQTSSPHHSTAAEMMNATGGVTYGLTLPSSPHGQIVGTAPVRDPNPAAEYPFIFGGATPGPCVVCHMWPSIFDTKDPNYLAVGEHSFNVNGVNGADYTASCQSCHPGITSFNMPARGDYDGNGKAEGVQDELRGMLKMVEQALAADGVTKVGGRNLFDTAKATSKDLNAIWNYRLVSDDGTKVDNAVHNFKYSIALLQASYKDLTGKDVPNATLMK